MLLVFCLLLAFAPAPQFQTLIQEGLAALENKDLAAARKSFEQATELEPASAPAWFLLARTYALSGDMTAALAAARKSGEVAGSDASILYNLAVFHHGAGESDLSIAAGERALAIENSADVRTVLGNAHAANGDWPKAIPHYEEARRLSPYSDEVLFNLAQAHLRLQDYPSAIAVLEEGRKTFNQIPQLELALGVAYYGQRRFTDSVDCFLGIMHRAPDIPQPYYFVGKMLENASDRLPEVKERAGHFEARHPRSPIGYVLHARVIILQLPPLQYGDEAERAHDLLQKALSIKEDQADAHYLLGTLLERKKDYAAAARHLERSIALNEKDPAPHFRLAMVYTRLGRK
ncbi:MAG: tetratricopeptide repeat protein, partial [bacterium]|nr:tetratricopeptide repeat protein [bacterium]